MNQAITHLQHRPRIGILGGGQLAKMTALAALQLGCEIYILDQKPHGPALDLATKTLIGDWNDPETLYQLAALTDIITLENEFVDANSLAKLEEQGHPLVPSSHSLALIQDKWIQKQTLRQAGLPVADSRLITQREDIVRVAEELGWPLVLKTRRNGYDGKGNAKICHAGEIETAWNRLNGSKNALYAEAFYPFTRELAIIITRSQQGEQVAYPVVESIQHDHICSVIRAPAPVRDTVVTQATELAQRAIATVNGRGSFGVEFFLINDEQVIINELAPRVHNSGHYTIEACMCSQFENHIRAILGWPLGSTQMVSNAAVMVNLLGQGAGSGWPVGIDRLLQTPQVHLHNYGKTHSEQKRKMGHITVTGETLTMAESLAYQAAKSISYGHEAHQ